MMCKGAACCRKSYQDCKCEQPINIPPAVTITTNHFRMLQYVTISWSKEINHSKGIEVLFLQAPYEPWFLWPTSNAIETITVLMAVFVLNSISSIFSNHLSTCQHQLTRIRKELEEQTVLGLLDCWVYSRTRRLPSRKVNNRRVN